MKYKIPLLYILTAVSLIINACCLGQTSQYAAQSNGQVLYYILSSVDQEQNKTFNLFTAKADSPEIAYYLNTYSGIPVLTTEHNGELVAFYKNGSVICYSQGNSSTYQSYDSSYLPVDAASLNGKLYLLAQKNNEYTIFNISHNTISTIANLGDKLINLTGTKIFYYDKRIYLAGNTQDGSIFCDAINDNGLAGLDITISDNLKNCKIADIMKVNRTVVFILIDDQNSSTYYTSGFINNQLNGKQKLDINSLANFSKDNSSFVLCGDDFALTVLSGNIVHIQKFDIEGNKIGDTLSTYELNVIDSSSNIYIQAFTIALPAIIVITIIFGLKKAMAGGELPKTAQGLPAPLTLRAPAFFIDLICISFIMDGIIAILGKIGIVDQEQVVFTLNQFQTQLQNSGTFNIDIGPILLIMSISYLVILVYFTIFEWRLAATPGKMLFALKIADYETLAPGKVSLFKILIRNIYRIMELLPLIIPVIILVMIISPRKQRPGDMAAGTTVILAKMPTKPKGNNIDRQA